MRMLFDTYGAVLVKAIAVHTGYVLVSVAVGFLLGLALGILLSRVPRWSGVILPVVSIFQAGDGLENGHHRRHSAGGVQFSHPPPPGK